MKSCEPKNALGSFLLQIFANWYEPFFARRSRALCREHELAADQLSVSIVGGETTCNALIRTEIVGTYLSKKVSDTLRRSVVDHPEPFRDLYHFLRAEVSSKLEESQIQTTLLRAWKAHKEFDTHPSLSTRLKAIQPSRDWSNIDAVAKDFINLEPVVETPADFFFSKQIGEIRQTSFKLSCWQLAEPLMSFPCGICFPFRDVLSLSGCAFPFGMCFPFREMALPLIIAVAT
ncbi:MAG: M48 family metalloprotease [Cyanobacteria bacterium SZAS-4]|nr:M48 family metalloprotease [Cyanobacteria bacterium SZAS-4]